LDYEAFAKSIFEAQKKWGISDSSKAMADIFRNMSMNQEPSYVKGIIEAAQAASSMEETLKLSFQNLGLTSLAENSLAGKVAMQWAAAPLEELKQTGFFKLFPTEPQIKILTEAIGIFESRFRLPEFAEAVRLVEPFQASIAASLAQYAIRVPDLQIAFASMQTPWLDILKEERSIKAFAELQGIGEAVRSLSPFDENLAGMLRANLGDFRERITWRPEVLADLEVRSDFYASLGFDLALTDFPLLAFEECLQIAGLGRSVIPPSTDVLEIHEEEQALSRTNAAHNKLQRFERTLRGFIAKHMTRAFGPNWPKHRLPNGMYDEWQERKHTAEQAGAETRPLIEYADFTDYEPLICRRDNWREVFAPFFKRPESVRESFQRLYPIRVDTMHARLITHEDKLFLEVEIIRLTNVIPQ
jgi:hypothetical protein